MLQTNQPKLIVILGETASGKSELAMGLAQKFNGEIVCADSRTIYKHLDIGTAKPTKAEQNFIPHHMLDIVEPNQKFNAAEFKEMANNIIKDINNRNKLPILVGGSGLYIDSVIFDYDFGKVADSKERKKLESKSLTQLHTMARKIGINDAQVNFANRRHLSRAIENKGVIKQPNSLRSNTLVLGLEMDRADLEKRITKRVDNMFRAGFADEVRQVVKTYGWDNESMTGIGYRAVRSYLDEEIDEAEAKVRFVRGDLLLAKKQRTWFKRNKYVHWTKDPREAHNIVADFLNKTN